MIESITIADIATYASPPEEMVGLSQFNFLFGSNGSGKTTVSRVIADESNYPTCRVSWKAGSKLQPMVYNHDFVDRNFHQTVELKGVFTLGEQQKDTLAEIAAAKAELDALSSKIENLNQGLQSADGTTGKKAELVTLESDLKVKCWARQQTEEPEEEPIRLSKHEDPLSSVVYEDLSEEALNRYRVKAFIKPIVGSPEFDRLLRQQGLLTGEGSGATPTGFGFLLFGKQPRNAVPQAGVLARAELADGKESREEFGAAMVLVPQQLEDWLNKILPSTLDRSRMERREQVDLPFEMIREAVVNALIHRDYDIAGQKCQLVVTPETIIIKSPGGPISPITLDQMRSFTAPMKSRNPVLHYVFARMGMAEEQGYGLTSLKNHAEQLGLPLPSYTMEGDSLVLTIYRTAESATKSLGDAILDQLSAEEQKGWTFMAAKSGTTQSEYARIRKVTARTAQRHLSHFVDLGLLRRIGRGPATEYLKP